MNFNSLFSMLHSLDFNYGNVNFSKDGFKFDFSTLPGGRGAGIILMPNLKKDTFYFEHFHDDLQFIERYMTENEIMLYLKELKNNTKEK